MHVELTVIIPTHNRHNYLTRLLNYYSESNLNIIVCDSSDVGFPHVKNYPGINYFYYPNTNMMTKLYHIIDKVETKYCVLCADDDFIIVNGASDCVHFLEANPDYSSAQGLQFTFSLTNSQIVYKLDYINSINRDINNATAWERCTSFFSDYFPIFYSVQRTENYKSFLQIIVQQEFFNYVIWEIFHSYYTLIKGKNKTIPVFFGLRDSSSHKTYTKQDEMDIISTHPKYHEIYSRFLKTIVELYKVPDMISTDKAKQYLDNSLQAYIEMYYPSQKKMANIKSKRFLFQFLASCLRDSKKIIIRCFLKFYNLFYLNLIRINKPSRNLRNNDLVRIFKNLQIPTSVPCELEILDIFPETKSTTIKEMENVNKLIEKFQI